MSLHKTAECSKGKYLLKIAGLYCLVMLIASCATSTPDHLKEYSRDPSKKIQLKAFFPAGPFFNLDHIFLEGDVEDYDLQIIARSKDLSSKINKIKTKGKKGQYQSDASVFVENAIEVNITDISGKEVLTIIERGSSVGAWHGFGLEKEVSEKRAEKAAISDGVRKIAKSVEASIISRVLNSSAIRNLEKKGGSRPIINNDKALFEETHILISSNIKKGMSDEVADSHAEDLAKTIKKVFRKRFENVEIISDYKQVKENQIILQPLRLKVYKSNYGDAYYGRGGHVSIEAEIDIVTLKDSRSFSFQGNGFLNESFLTAFPQQILGVATFFTYSKLQSKMYNSVAGKRAENIIANELLNRVLYEPDYVELVESIENNQLFSANNETENMKKLPQYQARKVSYKLPYTCVLYLPANIENIKARANFNRSISINNEKQSGTAEADIGAEFKKVLLEELNKYFPEVLLFGEVDNNSTGTYNPYDLQLIVELEYRNTTVQYKPNPIVILDASVNFKTSTGAIYKKIDVTNKQSIHLGDGAGPLLSVLDGLSITRALAEGSLIEKAFENGANSAVREAVMKVTDELDNNLIDNFAEFAAYDSAVKSRSLSDIQHFLAVYPASKYVDELTAIADELMYDFAVSADIIEPYVDYLNAMPNGKYRVAIIDKLEHMLSAEIYNGNKQLCSIYFEFISTGKNINEIEKACKVH